LSSYTCAPIRPHKEQSTFLELRQYRIFPCKRDEWVKFMEERIMPGQLAHGVVIVGSFVGQEEQRSSSAIGSLKARLQIENSEIARPFSGFYPGGANRHAPD
jgi:hypothetical protein